MQTKNEAGSKGISNLIGSANTYDPQSSGKVGTGKVKKKKPRPKTLQDQIKELVEFKQMADVVMGRQHEAIQALMSTIENVALVANRANGIGLALVKYLVDKEAATSEEIWSRVALLEKMAQDAQNELQLDTYLSADLEDYLDDIAEMIGSPEDTEESVTNEDADPS